MTDLDMTPRYAPDRVIIASAMKLCPVTSYRFHPANSHKGSAIKAEWSALELMTAKGSRWYGCHHAYINSELRMVIVGTPERDEVRMKWPIVPEDKR
jgi:hypothetical protein